MPFLLPKTLNTLYVALGAFPFAVYSMVFFWTLRHRTAPISSKGPETSETFDPNMLFFTYALLVALLLPLMWHHRISMTQVGLRADDWALALLVGCLTGLLWGGLYAMVLHLFPAIKPRLATSYLQKGNVLLWILVFIAGAFGEEFWRAFCLALLRNLGYSDVVSVTLTVAAFVLGHPRLKFGGIARVSIFGVIAALLFLWLGSLLATCSAHLVGNLGALYWIRKSRVQAASAG